jgi:hypothetical protein
MNARHFKILQSMCENRDGIDCTSFRGLCEKKRCPLIVAKSAADKGSAQKLRTTGKVQKPR